MKGDTDGLTIIPILTLNDHTEIGSENDQPLEILHFISMYLSHIKLIVYLALFLALQMCGKPTDKLYQQH